VWDIRSFRKPIGELVGHTDAVHGVKWAPFNDTVLMSYGVDRTVICWDLANLNTKPVEEDDDHANPELVFKHCGHTATVRDAVWAPFDDDEWTVASVDDNNLLQLWAPHEEVYNDEQDADQYNTDVV
jgi:histone-binding protein RBBP4